MTVRYRILGHALLEMVGELLLETSGLETQTKMEMNEKIRSQIIVMRKPHARLAHDLKNVN